LIDASEKLFSPNPVGSGLEIKPFCVQLCLNFHISQLKVDEVIKQWILMLLYAPWPINVNFKKNRDEQQTGKLDDRLFSGLKALLLFDIPGIPCPCGQLFWLIVVVVDRATDADA
jgi:hypothetical protein